MASYDQALLDEAPEVTAAQKQRFYDAELLYDKPVRASSRDKLEPLRPETTTPGGGEHGAANADLEAGGKEQSTNGVATIPPASKTPFWKTRKGIIIIVVAAVVIIGAAVGGGVGGALSSRDDKDDNSSGTNTGSGNSGAGVVTNSATTTAAGGGLGVGGGVTTTSSQSQPIATGSPLAADGNSGSPVDELRQSGPVQSGGDTGGSPGLGIVDNNVVSPSSSQAAPRIGVGIGRI